MCIRLKLNKLYLLCAYADTNTGIGADCDKYYGSNYSMRFQFKFKNNNYLTFKRKTDIQLTNEQ